MFSIFLNPWLLGGALFLSVPIILHLIMRQQPKRIEFPALRFIRLREHANRRRMRLRHWLLLALRCAAIALIAAALARPRLSASSFFAGQEAPVAAAFIFDTSPRLQYKYQNQVRLDAAKETALWLLPQLPAESEIAVLDTGLSAAAFSVDRVAAHQKIERLETFAAGRPLQVVVEDALRLVKEHDKPRKELYVFTDLTLGAWTPDNASTLTNQLAAQADVALYLIDVGAVQPKNLSLGEIRLSKDQLALKSPWRLEIDARSVGLTEERGLKLYLPDKNGKPEVRSQQSLRFEPGGSQSTTFSLAGMTEPGVYNGLVKIDGEDALGVDDTRYFTIEVRPAWKVLLAATPPVETAVYQLRRALTGTFQCDVCATEDLLKTNLTDYSAVCLLDPKPLAAGIWQQLSAYVRQGGGLALYVGRNAVPRDQFNDPAALELLPAKLLRQVNSANWKLHLVPADREHPVLKVFQQSNTAGEWLRFPVARYWELDEPQPGTTVVMAYSDNRPALLERAVPGARGRVLMLTTPVSESAREREPWNTLATGDNAWPFVVLSDKMLFYLAGAERLNYHIGEVVELRVPAGKDPGSLILNTPRGDQISQSPDLEQRVVTISTTDAPGSYLLRSGGVAGIQRGFSVNLLPESTNLERLTEPQLHQIFGEKRYRLAQNRDEIVRDLNSGRVGVELFPWLIALVAFALAAEHFLSSRFYRQSVQPDAVTRHRIVPEAAPQEPPTVVA